MPGAGVCPAGAQLRPGAEDRAAALNAERQQPGRPAAGRSRAQPPAPARIIQHIVVAGTQRVEPGTVLTYMNMREGEPTIPPMSIRR